MKLTDHTYACNNLTSFDFQVHAITGNGNDVNQLKLALKNLWNHNKWTYFVADFIHWELLCSGRSKYYLDLHNNLNFLGAAAKLPGLMERISNDLISNRPFKSTTGVTCAENLTLDGFRGMQKFAQDFIEVDSVWITKSEYEEKGGDVLKVHCCSNRWFLVF